MLKRSGFVLILFFLLFFYQLYYNSSLLFTRFQPAFYFDAHFINQFFLYPGGPGELLSLFLFQFFANPVVAALLFTFILMVIPLSVMVILKNSLKNSVPWFFSLVPLFIVLFFYNAYTIPLAPALKYAFVLFLAALYSTPKTPLRFTLLVLSPFIYFILGGWFSLVFLALVAAIEIGSNKILPALVFFLMFAGVFALSAFIAARYLFYISLKEAFFYALPTKYFHAPYLFTFSTLFYLMSFFLPVFITFWTVFKKLVQKHFFNKNLKKIAWLTIPANALGILIFVVLLMLTTQHETKRKIYIDFLAEHEQWRAVLNEAKKMRQYDWIVEFQSNRAMFFTGCLLDSLFYIDHPIGVNGLFVDRIMSSQIAFYASDLYFDLGYINAAQVMAYEYHTKFPYDPRVLKRLALTNSINGHYKKAEKFLLLLNKSLMYKSWVQKNSALMDENKVLKIPLVAEKRKFLINDDFFIDSQEPNRDLVALLESSSENKMVVEYLLAYYLLECKLGNLAAHINLLHQLGYPAIPAHIEEAALMYQTGAKATGGQLIEGLTFRRDVFQRFVEFNKILVAQKTVQNRKAQLLQHNFEHTFWYYLFDGGKDRAAKLKRRKVENDY